MKKHIYKALVAFGLSCTMMFTSIIPSATLLAGEVTAQEDVAQISEEESANIALTATASAAYTNTYGISTDKINDGTLATEASTGWNCWGAAEEKYPMEVTLTWEEAQTMSSTRVMWWADGGGVSFPGAATLQYLDTDGTTWLDLAEVGVESGGFNGEDGVWNPVNFGKTVTTTGLRLLITRGSGYNAVGISEWEVYAEPLAETITGASISGASKVNVGKKDSLTGAAKPGTLSESVTYAWSITEGDDCLAFEGDTDKRNVTIKGLKTGTAKVKLTITKDDITQETETEIRVTDEKIESVDTYKTSTAAGVAPILPDSVVANGLEFDEPTSSTLSQYGFEFGERFDSKLVPVVWEDVDPSVYAADKVGTTFTVKGKVTYGEQEFDATAEITVNTPAEAGSSNSSVTFENVQLEDNFWLPKQETNATASLDKAILEIEKASGGEPNFDNAIKKLNGEAYNDFSGFVFQDSDIYKSIEAISYTLSATQNETREEMVAQRKKLEDKLESWIQKIEKVQYADGYIDTFFTLRSQSYSGGGKPGTHRYWEMSNHELYNAGHFLEGVVAYTRYREGINKPDYRLYVAGKRFADGIVELFGPNGTRNEVPGHEEIELALVKFGKLAEEYEGKGTAQKYYDTVQTLIDKRGHDQNSRDTKYYGGEYSQDATPFAEEANAVGHSVRANYYYTGITDIATLLPEGDETRAKYINSLDTIWNSVTERKTYITGGIGTTAPGSSAEGFGADYVLPPDQSYCEICAAIGAANWNQRMNLLHEDGKYADMVETNLYNSILVGTNLDGNRFFYSTLLRTNHSTPRSEWFGCACCPPNLMRTIAALGGYMYNVHNDNVFVNMFAGSTSNVNVNGTSVSLKQETNYPWGGDVKMTVNPETDKTFAMKIRIPGWVSEQKNQNVVIKVNGEAVSAQAEKGYVTVNRSWKKGDVVNIEIPMEIRFTESHELVESTQGQIAIERGPIVYCIEKAGNAQLNSDIENFDPLNFVIPRDAQLTANYNDSLLNGVVEITGDVKYATGKGAEMIDAKLQAVPYYAWNNRGDDADYVPGTIKNDSSRMLIWTMADSPIVKETSVRDYATPSVSYVGWGMGAENIADGNDNTFWNGHSDENMDTSPQWMMYDFGDKQAVLKGAGIHFYDDNGGVMLPNSIKIEYTDENGEWKEVTPVGEWTYVKNEAVNYQFEEITTSKIRVTMDHAKVNGSCVAVAVKEWTLDGHLFGEEVTGVDKASLKTAIENAEKTYTASKYTEESFSVYEKALEAAKTVLADEQATQAAVDEAKSNLESAIAGLQEKVVVSKTALQTAVTKAKKTYVKSKYTAASWSAYDKALKKAQSVLANESATQKEVDNVLSGLKKAITGLKAALLKGDQITVKGVVYKVTDAKAKEVTALKPQSKKSKSLTIAETVKIKNVTCKVVSISPSAFTGMKSLTKVTIAKNVKTIGSKAFYNDTKLKSIKISSSSVKSIGKYAFKGIAKSAAIDVPNSKVSSYKKMLKTAKTASSVKVK